MRRANCFRDVIIFSLTAIKDNTRRVSSRNFILGGKLTDHVAVRPRYRLHNYNILGGKLGQFGGEVELFGGEASPAPPLR